jgi:hypothetical protein
VTEHGTEDKGGDAMTETTAKKAGEAGNAAWDEIHAALADAARGVEAYAVGFGSATLKGFGVRLVAIDLLIRLQRRIEQIEEYVQPRTECALCGRPDDRFGHGHAATAPRDAMHILERVGRLADDAGANWATWSRRWRRIIEAVGECVEAWEGERPPSRESDCPLCGRDNVKDGKPIGVAEPAGPLRPGENPDAPPGPEKIEQCEPVYVDSMNGSVWPARLGSVCPLAAKDEWPAEPLRPGENPDAPAGAPPPAPPAPAVPGKTDPCPHCLRDVPNNAIARRLQAAEEVARFGHHVVGECVLHETQPNETEIESCACGYSQALKAWHAAIRRR